MVRVQHETAERCPDIAEVVVRASRLPGAGETPAPQFRRPPTAADLPGRPDRVTEVPPVPQVDEAAADDEDPLRALLETNVVPIDLAIALQLAGEQNPAILLGQQRVVEAVALRQLAAAQFLPTLNLGTSVDAHWGVLQQSNGNILSVR